MDLPAGIPAPPLPERPPAPPAAGFDFSTQPEEKLLTQAINKLEGHTRIVELDANLKGVEVEYAQRWGQHWTTGAYASTTYSGKPSVGVRIRGAW